MDKNIKNIFNYLTRHEGFYMDQCKNIHNKKDIWLALKNFSEGIFAVIITNNENADNDERDAREYLLGKGVNFRLSVIVLCDEEYLSDYNKSYSKVVVSTKDSRIIFCDSGLEGLGNISAEIIRREKRTNKGNIKKYWVTMSLIIINVVLYIITGVLSGNFFDIDGSVLLLLGGKYGPLINEGEWWRLFTCNFLHGGFIHIASNMYFLYSVGTEVEEIYGKVKYIVIYVIAGISSSLLSYYITPNTLSIGASGALFGILGAMLTFAIKERNRIDKGVIVNIIGILVINLYIGTNVISNIDNYAHFGGFLGGVISSSVCLIINKK